MDKDIKFQIERAKELFQELENSCNSDLASQKVSDKTKNLTQEVLLKIRHLLDQSIYKFFEKNYLPKLTQQEIKSVKVYFPIVTKKEDLRSILGRSKMSTLENDFPDFYNFLDSIQPYNNNYLWLKMLADFSAEKHIRLTPQTKKETKTMTAKTENVSVTMPIDNPNFSVHQGSNCQVFIGGVPVRFTNQGIMPLSPGLKTEITRWISFLFENTEINVLWLCKKAVNDGSKIIEKVFDFL